MNPGHNLFDCIEMILQESVRDVSRDQYLVPAWMMRDLRVAAAPFIGQRPKRPQYCPHGYRLENLRDGTDTCSGCEVSRA